MATKKWETESRATADKPTRQETGIGKAKVVRSVAKSAVEKREAEYLKLPKARSNKDQSELGKSKSAMNKMDARYLRQMEKDSVKASKTASARAASQNRIKDK